MSKRFSFGMALGLLAASLFAVGQGVNAPQGGALTLFDTNGNSYTFPNSSGAVSLGAAGAAGADESVIVLEEDFISTLDGSARNGNLGWFVNTGSVIALAAEANHPGIVQNSANTGAPDQSALFLGLSTITAQIVVTDIERMMYIVQVDSLTTIKVRIGVLNDSDTADPTDGVWFEFDPAASSNWRTITEAASTQTANATSTTVATGTWYKFEMVRLSGGNWEFFLDDVSQFTHSTNLPTVGVIPTFTVENTTAPTRSIRADYFSLTTNTLTR